MDGGGKEEEAEQWKHHDALPLLHGGTRRREAEMWLQTREPRPRNVFWAFTPWPSPDNPTPPDIFLRDHVAPGAFNSLVSSLPPDLFIKVSASRSQPLASSFVGVHTPHLGPLAPLFRSPFSTPSSPYTFSLKPSLHFSTLLSLLSLAHSSSHLSTLTQHCSISCIEDLVDIFDITSSLVGLIEFRRAFSIEPLPSIIARFKHNQLRSRAHDDSNFPRGKTKKLYGFDLTHHEREHLNMVFLDILDMPYRTKILQDGLLIVNDTPLFVQDVTKIIVPRGHTSSCPMRSYCLLVPKDQNAHIIYNFLSFFQFVTFNAQVHAQMIGYRKALSCIVYEEDFIISLKAPISDTMELTFLAKTCKLKVDKTVYSSEEEDDRVALFQYSGSIDGVRQFLSQLMRLKPLLEKTSCTLKLQRLSYPHFRCLFAMLDICHFSFLQHIAVISDKLYYVYAIVTLINTSTSVLQDIECPLDVQSEIPTQEARRIVEVCDDK